MKKWQIFLVSMKKWQIFLVSLLVLLIPLAIGFYNLGLYKLFAPKYQNVRRKVFKETRSYNEGKVQQLAKYKLEYEQSENKEIVANAIRHMFADFNCEEIPYGLKTFLKEIRGY